MGLFLKLTSGSRVSLCGQQNEIVQFGGVSVRVVRLLAKGTNAHVYLVRSSATSDTFALKRVLCRSQDVEDDVQTELRVFRVRLQVISFGSIVYLFLTGVVVQSVKHLNIMPLIEFSETRVQLGIEVRGVCSSSFSAVINNVTALFCAPSCSFTSWFRISSVEV